MRVVGRRKAVTFFLALGICLVALAVALNVGWILLNLQQIALLVFGIIFFAIIITGLVLNTIFLVREIRRNEQHDAFLLLLENWWRRRESNPHPKVATKGIYTFSQVLF